MKKLLPFFLILVGLTACSTNTSATAAATEIIMPTKTTITNSSPPPDYLPKAEDSRLKRAKAFPQSIDLVAVETSPLRLELVISGYMPTPCHQLRVYVPPPDEEKNIYVEVYSVTDPEILCQQVLRTFNTSVDLGTYPDGSYRVFVNGDFIGNFDV